MRLSRASIIIAAAALAGAITSQGAPVLTDSAATFAAQPSLASTTFAAAIKLRPRPSLGEHLSDLSNELYTRMTDDAHEKSPVIEGLQARGVRDQVDPLDAINNLIRELDEATHNPDSTGMALIEKPLFSDNERKLSAWAASNPVFTQAYERLRAKLPKHPNGTPDLDALGRIGTEQRLLSEYLRVQRLIYNASKRKRRGAAGRDHIDVLDASPEADAVAPASSRAKRKRQPVGEDDLKAARDTAPRESMQQASSSIVASSAGTDGAASASSAATQHHDPAASLSRDSPPPSAVLPPHASSAPSASSSPSPLPMQPVVEPAAPPSSPRSSAPLLRWPSFSVPEYSPLDPW